MCLPSFTLAVAFSRISNLLSDAAEKLRLTTYSGDSVFDESDDCKLLQIHFLISDQSAAGMKPSKMIIKMQKDQFTSSKRPDWMRISCSQ